MLPKIIVSECADKSKLLELAILTEKNVMGYEGSEGKVDDLRSWVITAINIARQNEKLEIVIWNADTLSPDCQAILLKPLEELGGNIKMYLMVRSENKMLPTIVSRCIVEYAGGENENQSSYWNEVRKCWASGPAACISFSDSLTKDEAKLMIREVIIKLKDSLETEINNKRLQVIENALSCLAELEGTNVNQKLTIDNFLIGSWRLIKA